ncbi:MAG TPA: Crp/Fnr family transcriptional regulator [Verrucomicrobiae bacterium]|nr:Crp/Fnr family transcriptional regulator [Verrucomicrobiae bacterium]
MDRTVLRGPYEDPSFYLPRKPAQEFARKHTIYGPGEPSNLLYMVRSGRVLVRNSFDSTSPSVTRIVSARGMFGEASLIGSPDPGEWAITLDRSSVMSWTMAEVEQQMTRDARLRPALLSYFALRCAELTERLEALAFYRTQERVMLGLLQLAETLGAPMNGATRMAPLSHKIIADYVGTSRELVTLHMCEFRQAGLLQYSRSFIDANVPMMRQELDRRGIDRPASEGRIVRTAV